MKAGDLDRRITIQQNTGGPDSVGQIVDTWGNVAVVWAKIEWKNGSEEFGSAQRSAKQTAEFTIRYRPGITPKMRVLYDGSAYDIEDVRETERRETLVLIAYAREVQSGPQ